MVLVFLIAWDHGMFHFECCFLGLLDTYCLFLSFLSCLCLSRPVLSFRYIWEYPYNLRMPNSRWFWGKGGDMGHYLSVVFAIFGTLGRAKMPNCGPPSLSLLPLSCRVLSSLVVSGLLLFLSCLGLSCPVRSCLVWSCLVFPCLVLSCLVLSFLVFLPGRRVKIHSLFPGRKLGRGEITPPLSPWEEGAIAN